MRRLRDLECVGDGVFVRNRPPALDPWGVHRAGDNGLVEAGFIVLRGPLADEHRVVHAVEAESEDAVRATFARDPWSGTHLELNTIEPWTLDARSN